VPICVATDFIECHWHFDLFGSQWIGMFFFLFNLFGSSQIVGLAPVISRKPYQNFSEPSTFDVRTNAYQWCKMMSLRI
jgi:hypothetical protein